jgi:hypothetical protein
MRPGLTKPVLRSGREPELAAWELFAAIRQLCPDRYAELQEIGSDLADVLKAAEYDNEDDFGYVHPMTIPAFERRVLDWTQKNNISCRAVDAVAAMIASGRYGGPEVGVTDRVVSVDKQGNRAEYNREDLPSIHLKPFDESHEEFMRRAGKFSQAVRAALERAGFPPRQRKVQTDYFRYLVAHRILGVSLEVIADPTAPLDLRQHLPLLTVKGLDAAIRRATRLIGLTPRKAGRPRKQAPQNKPLLFAHPES